MYQGHWKEKNAGGKFINRVINKLNFLKKLWMMTTFILAPDSFKESMTAEQACAAMQRGIQNIIPDAVCIHVPMADWCGSRILDHAYKW